MTPLNPFFRQEVASEQRLVQDLVNEHLRMYGQEVYYMPRKYMGTDSIMRENILAKFDDAYPIEAYVANVDGFQGSGDLMTKFGIRVTDEATFIISKERFEDYIGELISNIDATEDRRLGSSYDRPMEGDLIYFPLTDSLFEIKFVEHENPFYQLGQLTTFELRCELFEYEQEVFDTDIENIDDNVADIGYYVTLTLAGTGQTATASFTQGNGAVHQIIIENDGYGYDSVPTVAISTSPNGSPLGNATAVAIGTIGAGSTTYSVQSIKITNPGFGYTQNPTVTIIGSGDGAKAKANIADGVLSLNNYDGGSEYSRTPIVSISTSPSGVSTANADVEAVVSAAGTVRSLRFNNAGFGYTQSPTVDIETPYQTLPALGIVGVATANETYTVTETIIESVAVQVGIATTSGVTLASPTDTITGIDTSVIQVGFGLTGSGIGAGTSVVGIGSTNAPDVIIVSPSISVGVGTTTLVFTSVGFVDVAISTSVERTTTTGVVTSIALTRAGTGYSTAPTITIADPSGFSAGFVTAGIASVGIATTVSSLNIANVGAGYGVTPVLTISNPSGFRSGIITAGVGIGTTVNSITIGSSGAYYSVAPTVTISSPLGIGSTATAVAFINSAGIITGVNLTSPGFGYTNSEIITVSLSGGINIATGTAQISSIGIITGLTITNPGFGYTTTPSVTLTGGITTATATAFIDSEGVVTGTSITNIGAGYTTAPSITFSDPSTTLNTGNYIQNEMVTGQTGLATALVKDWNRQTRTLKVYSVAGNFRPGEIIAGSATTTTSGNLEFVTSMYLLESISYEHDEETGVDAFESNTEIQDAATDVDGIVDWTETNPFGTF